VNRQGRRGGKTERKNREWMQIDANKKKANREAQARVFDAVSTSFLFFLA